MKLFENLYFLATNVFSVSKLILWYSINLATRFKIEIVSVEQGKRYKRYRSIDISKHAQLLKTVKAITNTNKKGNHSLAILQTFISNQRARFKIRILNLNLIEWLVSFQCSISISILPHHFHLHHPKRGVYYTFYYSA